MAVAIANTARIASVFAVVCSVGISINSILATLLGSPEKPLNTFSLTPALWHPIVSSVIFTFGIQRGITPATFSGPNQFKTVIGTLIGYPIDGTNQEADKRVFRGNDDNNLLLEWKSSANYDVND